MAIVALFFAAISDMNVDNTVLIGFSRVLPIWPPFLLRLILLQLHSSSSLSVNLQARELDLLTGNAPSGCHLNLTPRVCATFGCYCCRPGRREHSGCTSYWYCTLLYFLVCSNSNFGVCWTRAGCATIEHRPTSKSARQDSPISSDLRI